MFSVFTVCFFGHRQIDDFRMVEQRIERLIDKLLNEHEYVEFLVGRDGEFDQLVTSAILRCRKRLDSANCSVTWVMPYLKSDYIKNRKRSNLCVFCVTHRSGGAYQTLRYAEKADSNIINLRK